jgi:hypothetical protein
MGSFPISDLSISQQGGFAERRADRRLTPWLRIWPYSVQPLCWMVFQPRISLLQKARFESCLGLRIQMANGIGMSCRAGRACDHVEGKR